MQNRYEEYLCFKDNIPFVLHQNLKRTDILRSRQANWHENIEIQICNNGEGRVMISGVSYPFSSGNIIAVSSGMIHYTGTSSNLEYSCLIIDSSFCRNAGIEPDKIIFEPLIIDNDVFDIILKICTLYNEKNDALRVARLRVLTLDLLITMCERHVILQTPKNCNDNENAKKAVNYIKIHYNEKISLDNISKELYINKFLLTRQFKSAIGMTIFEYINYYRCNMAASLISQGKGIGDAAHECGFENMSFFTKMFKRYIGKLPREYRTSI